MEEKRINEFTYDLMVSASQMAYVEEAHKTYTLLQNFNELYRYILRPDKISLISDEIKALINYSEIIKTIYGDRIGISIEDDFDNKNMFIEKMSVVDFLDEKISKMLAKQEKHTHITIKLEGDDALRLKANFETDGDRFTLFKILREEGI